MDPFKVFILKDLLLKYSRIKTYSDSRASSVFFLGLVNGTWGKAGGVSSTVFCSAILSKMERRKRKTFVCYEPILTFDVKSDISEICLVRGSDILPA